jgi:hypothetical protein
MAVRLLAFTGLAYLAARLRQGRNWARVALAVLYGGIGTLSLVVGPATWLAEGGSLADAVAAADLRSVLFAASRLVHLGAVIAALLLMFHPAANAYLRATTQAAAPRGTRQRGEVAQPGDRRSRTPSHHQAGLEVTRVEAPLVSPSLPGRMRTCLLGDWQQARRSSVDGDVRHRSAAAAIISK